MKEKLRAQSFALLLGFSIDGIEGIHETAMPIAHCSGWQARSMRLGRARHSRRRMGLHDQTTTMLGLNEVAPGLCCFHVSSLSHSYHTQCVALLKIWWRGCGESKARILTCGHEICSLALEGGWGGRSCFGVYNIFERKFEHDRRRYNGAGWCEGSGRQSCKARRDDGWLGGVARDEEYFKGALLLFVFDHKGDGIELLIVESERCGGSEYSDRDTCMQIEVNGSRCS
jgi:hypothetical protein